MIEDVEGSRSHQHRATPDSYAGARPSPPAGGLSSPTFLAIIRIMSCNACVGCDEPSLAVASSGAAALDRMIASALTDLHVALSDAEQTKWELHFNVRRRSNIHSVCNAYIQIRRVCFA
jgi:hypothetical protein